MNSNYLNIEQVTPGMESLVSEKMKFKTSKFVWRIRFSASLDGRTINNKNVTVLKPNGAPLITNISYDTSTNTIQVEPLEPYDQDESYTLNISTAVRSSKGKSLSKQVSIRFKM